MQCPLCRTEAKIQSNKLVKKADGSYAHKLTIVCRDKNCKNYGSIVAITYAPVEVEDDDEE